MRNGTEDGGSPAYAMRSSSIDHLDCILPDEFGIRNLYPTKILLTALKLYPYICITIIDLMRASA